jgi:FkbM family methyltransferase
MDKIFRAVRRRFKRYATKFLRITIGKPYWRALGASRAFREILFDTCGPGKILLASGGSEYFLVSSSDKVIGRDVYCDGQFDFSKFNKALELIGAGFSPDLLLDVGANIGTICIPAIKRGIFKRAESFEPEPRNFALLAANVRLNGLGDKIALHNLALSDTEGGELEFELSEKNYGDHRIRIIDKGGLFDEANREVIRVRCTTLDAFNTAGISANSTLIWMDTQGFEGYILNGARKLLQSRIPMVIEFWPYGMQRSQSYDKLKSALIESGYTSLYDLADDEPHKVALDAQTLDGLFERLEAEGSFTDILVL